MITLQIILAIIVALLGYPVGLLIAKSTKEELKKGRKWFKLIMIASLLIMILSFLNETGTLLIFIETIFMFIFLMSFASFQESKNVKK